MALVSEHPGQNGEIIRAAGQAGWNIACKSDYRHLHGLPDDLHADAVVLMARHVDDHVLQAIRTFNSTHSLPVVLYTEDSMQESICAALSGGVSVHAIDCSNVGRPGTLLEIAMLRCGDNQPLKRELHKAKTTPA